MSRHPLDVDEREVVRVLRHEQHARDGALADAFDGVGLGVHRFGLRLPEAMAHRSDDLGEHVELGGEVPVEQALRHACLVADVADPCRPVPPLAEQRHRRVDELLLALAALFGQPSFVGGSGVVDGGHAGSSVAS